MARFLRFISLVILALDAATTTAASVSQEQLQRLAHDPTWLKLGHYSAQSMGSEKWRSAIHSNDFFLSPRGEVDPLQELEATLAAFAEPMGENPNAHAQCRFPARWLWLQSQLGNSPPFDQQAHCPDYSNWTRANSVESLSIVFATGYLGNPASYYGHTLLKFNFKNSPDRTRLMDVSVNYGALSARNDDAVTYIVKSVSGGYDGGFSHINFYFHNHNYGDIELRDLWEYQLNLPPAAVALIVAHAWEVLGKRYTYYFFRENCGYRMSEILQVVDGVKIIPDKWPWIIPQALVEEIGVAQYQGKPLLSRVVYHPSRQSRFYDKYRNLSPDEVQVLGKLVNKDESLKGDSFQHLPIPSKQAVLDTLIDYYQFVGAPLELAPRHLKQEYTGALAARYDLPPGLPDIAASTPPSPHLSRPLGWIQTGLARNTTLGDALLLRVRPAYYDVLDSNTGQIKNAALITADLQLHIRRGNTSIKKLDLIGVESASPALTGLPGDTGKAWKLHLGMEQQRLNCDDCLVNRLQADVGYGRNVSSSLFAAGYIGGALQNDRNRQGPAYGKVSADLIYRPNDTFGLRLSHEQRIPVGTRTHRYGVTSFESRWSMAPDHDLRLAYDYDGDKLITLGIGLYW